MKPSETTYIFTSEERERGGRRLQGPAGPGATIVKKKKETMETVKSS